MGVIPSSGNIWAAALNGELYCFGGINQHETSGSYVSYQINEKYNIETGKWMEVTPPLSNTVVTCQNKLYSVGVPTQVYDPSTDTWSNRTSMPESLITVRPTVMGDKIFVISGVTSVSLAGFELSDATYVYDPELDSWSTMASIPTPVDGYASAVLDDKIYIMGGAATLPNYSNWVVNLVQIFDPKTNEWTVGKPLPTGVYGAGACATLGLVGPKQIYVVGGQQYFLPWVTSQILNSHGTTFNQIYDPATGNWSTGASLPEPRWRCSLVNVNDTLFVVGGENGPADDASFDSPEKVVLDIARYQASNNSHVAVLIILLSPTNTSYAAVGDSHVTVPLTFEANATLSWVGYSLDGGANVTGVNGTSIELPVNSESLSLYANDTAGNWAVPVTVYFTVAWNGGTPPPEPFPWLPVAAVSVVVVAAVVAAAAVAYTRKRRRGVASP